MRIKDLFYSVQILQHFIENYFFILILYICVPVKQNIFNE